MREDDIRDIGGMAAIAEKLGKERMELEERNRRRRAKGRKPLPDDQERKDAQVLLTRYRTGDPTTVDGASALRMFEMRKAAMMDAARGHDEDLDDEEDPVYDNGPKTDYMPGGTAGASGASKPDPMTERAVREAESVRRVEDMKAGRIDHSGNWSEGGQRLEGGDDTSFPSSREIWGGGSNEGQGDYAKDDVDQPAPKKTPKQRKSDKAQNSAKCMMPAAAGLNEFKEDLYERLRVSFEGIETTLSDMQGRMQEIVTASVGKIPQEMDGDAQDASLKSILEKKSPVTFNVGGTKMTFDAVSVFHQPPCITVVSKIGSATITPKPGARLHLSYEMDGVKYEDDPVTFLGTRFDLPAFGMSFVGFIRDAEADMMDAEVQEG